MTHFTAVPASRPWFRLMICICIAISAHVQAQDALSLDQARFLALQNHPRIAAAELTQKSSQARIRSVDSAYYPNIAGVGTAAWANDDGETHLGAGGLSAPTVYSRDAVGIEGSLLISDFGRTHELSSSAQFDSQAAAREVDETKQEILFDVDQTYFTLLQALAVRRLALSTVTARQTEVDQVSILAHNQLRSDLDVGFATIALQESRLLLEQSTNDVSRGYLELSNLLSQGNINNRPLTDQAIDLSAHPNLDMLISMALEKNPNLARLIAQRDSLYRLARADGDQALPILSVVGAAGYIPRHEGGIDDHYAAAALNLTVPLFNGFAYSANHDDVYFQAQALDKKLVDASAVLVTNLRISIEKLEYLEHRAALTEELAQQADKSYQLAKTRYSLGSTSIIEFNQAELNQTDAHIGLIRATYDYRIQESLIDLYVGITDVLAKHR